MNRDPISRPIKILQVIDTLGVGGAETWLMELLRLWADNREASLDFLVTSGNRGVFDDEAERLGAKIHYLRFGRRTLCPFVSGFRELLREGRYNAIHDHQDFASGWHYLAGCGRLPEHRITHVHNPSYQIRNNYGVSASRRIVSRLGRCLVGSHATHVLGTSRQVLEEYGFFDPDFEAVPTQALHCGFDPSRFAGAPVAAAASLREEFGWERESKLVLFAGRIDQSPDPGHPQTHKNSGFAVEVYIEAASRDHRLCMILAGKGSPATAILERRVAEAGLSDRIRFLGIREDIARLMLGSDLLLFPSRGEGLGMVAVEAQASGLPVLMSTAVPMESVVLPELVTRLDLAEGVAAWVESLLQMIAIPRDLEKGNEAVRRSPFSLENSAKALLRVYRGGKEW